MKKRNLSTLVLAMLMITMMSISAWAVPGLVNYQGKLTDGDGIPLDDGYDMHFYIYDDITGGNALWHETQTVQVNAGIYEVKLGSATAFPDDLFYGDYLYLEIIVYNPDLSTWETLSPRQRLTSVPFAIEAAYADTAGDADTLDGMDSGDFTEPGHVHDAGDITSGTFSDARIPGSITRDTELASGLAGKADTLHNHDGSDITSGIVADARIDAAITRDSELTDGLAGKSNVGHNHDDLYYTKAHVDSLETRISTLEATVNQLSTLLASVTRNGNDITFSGVNLHIVNGTGATDGAVNTLGNLIVGYNELRGTGDDRTGSHNIVVGIQHNYSSYGGLVAGRRNTISGGYSSVSGGYINTASGSSSSVSGGQSRSVSGYYDWRAGSLFETY